MVSKIIDFLVSAVVALGLALILYFGIPWAMNEPIYCGNIPCSQVKK